MNAVSTAPFPSCAPAQAGKAAAIRNIAHRGLWDETVPQNSLEAFRRAWAAGATWVETDFHRTKAGQMVCIHAERELWMYTGCEKKIADLSPEEVASLRLDPSRPEAPTHVAPPCGGAGGAAAASPAAGNPRAEAARADAGEFRIPLLDEVLATVPPHGTVQAEIKGYTPDYPDRFDAAVRAAGLSEKNIVVSSFQLDALADFHRRLPSYRTLWLLGVPKGGDTDVIANIARCRDAGIGAFCPGLTGGDRALTGEEADAVRAAGLSLRVYGVNTPEALATARDIGAEAFTCNFWREAFDWARAVGGIELLA